MTAGSAIERPPLRVPVRSASPFAAPATRARPKPGILVPLLLLPSRLLLFAAAQAALALGLWAAGVPAAWDEAGGYWPLCATAANVASVVLLGTALRREGRTLREVFLPAKRPFLRDAKWLVLLVAAGALAGFLPNVGLSLLLYGSVAGGSALMVRSIPFAAAVAGVVAFPLTIAFAELPTYFGYIRPRLEERMGAFGAVGLSALFLAAQHLALPLRFDARFIVWRALAFLPFALLLGVVVRRRPSLMPYLMAIHGALDMLAALAVLSAADA